MFGKIDLVISHSLEVRSLNYRIALKYNMLTEAL